MRQSIGLFGLPDPALALSFPSRLRGFPAVPVCRTLAYPTHPLTSFAPPTETRATAGPALMSGLPSLGFLPSSRCQPAESTEPSVPGPIRSVLDVSHVLDGFLLHRPSRVYFTPQPRPGFALQGFSLSRSRTSSSLAVALLSFARGPCSRLPGCSRFSCPPSGLCSSRQSVASTQRFRSCAARSPPELCPPSGFPSDTVGRPSSPFRPRPFTALVVLPVSNLTCSCEPAFPVRGSWPAPPPRLAPLLWVV
jgi:hypothetical protein